MCVGGESAVKLLSKFGLLEAAIDYATENLYVSVYLCLCLYIYVCDSVYLCLCLYIYVCNDHSFSLVPLILPLK